MEKLTPVDIPDDIIVKDNLLFDDEVKAYIKLPFADITAQKYGFQYAEQMVKYLKEIRKNKE